MKRNPPGCPRPPPRPPPSGLFLFRRRPRIPEQAREIPPEAPRRGRGGQRAQLPQLGVARIELQADVRVSSGLVIVAAGHFPFRQQGKASGNLLNPSCACTLSGSTCSRRE